MPLFRDKAGRVIVDVEVDFNSDGSAFFVGGVYQDDDSEVDEDTLLLLDVHFAEYLDDVAFERSVENAEHWADTDY